MDYSVVIISICMYVERHCKDKLDVTDFEAVIGYSYPHIRKLFRANMGVALSRYILTRRLSYAAFDLAHSDKTLLDIATNCGFEQYDAFTRAFKRETGFLPSEFRRQRALAGRRLIAAGVYAPTILSDKTEVRCMSEHPESGILLGVPKVEYKWDECTPFPACLKACLNYMGQKIDYAHIMAASGAAFRLRWSTQYWDGGNVDIMYIYENETEAFRRSFKASGRDYRFLKRDGHTKQDFTDFIKKEIGAGRPVIALGIIGPPEACIVTGYRDDGNTLLGWNFFQDRAEYNNSTEFDENGYFISKNWWENDCTIMLMSVCELQSTPVSDKEILANALAIENRKPIVFPDGNTVACGQDAYDAWAAWTADDKNYGANITLPLLYERFMCQTDAQTMVGEGRYYASVHLTAVGERHPEVSVLCGEAAEYFRKASNAASERMWALMGGFSYTEETVRRYAEPETRKQIVALIREAAAYETEANKLIEKIVAAL